MELFVSMVHMLLVICYMLQRAPFCPTGKLYPRACVLPWWYMYIYCPLAYEGSCVYFMSCTEPLFWKTSWKRLHKCTFSPRAFVISFWCCYSMCVWVCACECVCVCVCVCAYVELITRTLLLWSVQPKKQKKAKCLWLYDWRVTLTDVANMVNFDKQKSHSEK